MKSIKYLVSALVAIFAMASCTTDDTYEVGPVEGEAVVFFPEQSTEIVVMPDEATEYEISVSRTDSSSAATYSYDVLDGGEGILFFGELSFAAGESESSILITFPEAQVGYTYTGSVAITDEEYAPTYKNSVLNFTVTRSYTWELVKGDNGETTGTWTDAFIYSFWSGVSLETKSVEIYEAKELPGFYRITNVYSADFTCNIFGVTEDEEDGYAINTPLNPGTCYSYIDATDPDKIYMPYQDLGYYLGTGYGYISIASAISYYFGDDITEEGYGTLVNGILTFPAQSILANYSEYDETHWYYANTIDFVITFPGAKEPAELYGVEYVGELTNGDGDISILLNFNVSDATESVKYAMLEGLDVDVEAIAEGIIDGSVESVEITENFTSYNIANPEAGIYTIVAVAFDDEGLAGAVTEEANSVVFRVSGGDQVARIAAGTYTISKVIDTDYGKVYEGDNAVVFTLTQSYIEQDKYYLTDFFSWGALGTFTAVLDFENSVLNVTPSAFNGFEVGFMEWLAYNSSKTHFYMYMGDGEDNLDPWQINVELVDGEYVMTSFATDAECGKYEINGTEIEDAIYTIDAGFIEAGATISTYVEPVEDESPAAAISRKSQSMTSRQRVNVSLR